MDLRTCIPWAEPNTARLGRDSVGHQRLGNVSASRDASSALRSETPPRPSAKIPPNCTRIRSLRATYIIARRACYTTPTCISDLPLPRLAGNGRRTGSSHAADRVVLAGAVSSDRDRNRLWFPVIRSCFPVQAGTVVPLVLDSGRSTAHGPVGYGAAGASIRISLCIRRPVLT